MAGGRAVGWNFLLYEEASDDAESRAVEYVRLFGLDRAHVRRRGTLLLVFVNRMQAGDRKLADDCL